MTPPNNIVISRTDSIGDVVLTLPMAAVIRQHYPGIKIGFLGKKYTRPVIEACNSIDVFIDVEEFLQHEVKMEDQPLEAILHVFPDRKIAERSKQLGIPLRIGTKNRVYHWYTCNRLVKLSRKNSPLHEAQLNLKLLEGLDIDASLTTSEIGRLYALNRVGPLPERLRQLLSADKYNLILHPKSQGNGREWSQENFIQLVQLLDTGKFKIFVSGVEKERRLLNPLFSALGERVTDITGIMDLREFIAFIAAADGLIASGTGPIHLAAALGIDAFGIFPPIKPVHPGRWKPLGPKAKEFVVNRDCTDCKKNSKACHCINEINASGLAAELLLAYSRLKTKDIHSC